MITSITEWHKISETALSVERAKAAQMQAKINQLIEAGKAMIEAANKAQELSDLKKVKSNEVKELLDKLNNTSIIAKGVLVEIVKPFKQNRLSTTAYMKFIEESTGLIGDDFKALHDEVVSLSKKIKTTEPHLRITKNTRNKETGTLSEAVIADLWNKIKSYFSKFTSLLSKTENNLDLIKNKTKLFLSLNESIGDIDLEEIRRRRRNDASKISHAKRREQNKLIATSLDKAKELIELTEQETYYLELKKLNQKIITDLLTEFSAKSVAIDDKIITLVNGSESEVLDIDVYKEKITNADNVSVGVAKMAEALMNMHKSVVEISGSVRQYADDTNSPDGTRNARFDWENKTVVLPNNEGIGSFMRKIWSKIKIFFKSFNDAALKVNIALSKI